MQAQDLGQIANLNGASFRSHNNFIAQAQATKHSGPIEPPVIYPNMEWADTASGLLKVRDTSNTRWWVLGKLGVSDAPPEIYNNSAPIPPALSDAQTARISSFRTVTEYGAKGDGVTDDTAAIIAAIADMPATGAHLYFPRGYYKISSNITLNKSGTYAGSGVSSCFIVQATPTSGSFTITAPFVDVVGFTFQTAGGVPMMMAGAYIEINASYVTIDSFRMFNCYYGIVVRPVVSVVTISRGWIRYIKDTLGVGIYIEGGFDLSIYDVGMWCDAGVFCAAGIFVRGCGDLTVDTVNIMQCGNDFVVGPLAGEVAASIFITNSFFDTATRGLFVCPSTGGSVVRCAATQNWFSSHTMHGIDITSGGGGIVDGFDINLAHCFLNAVDGVNVFGTGVSNVRINQAACAQNAAAGLAFSGNTTRFSVTNSRSGQTHGLSGNRYGLFVDTGCFGYIVNANDFTGNVSAIVDAGTGKVVANNL